MIAGTAIGAGMLALPLTTAAAGFYPTLLAFFACFLFMLYSVFLLLEANLMSEHPEANIISMTGERLGRWGQIVAWGAFLLLLYSVSAAYMSAGGSLITTLLNAIFSGQVPMFVGMFTFALAFGVIVYFGTHVVDHINKVLILGLILSFIFLLGKMAPFVHPEYTQTSQPLYLLAAIPVIILSFTSHVIVPSIRTYLSGHVKQLVIALSIGTFIPLAFYVCWEFLILSLIPSSGPQGLVAIAKGPHPVAALTDTLKNNLGLHFIAAAVGAFSFCALVTSFLAVNLSLKDFLADGLKIPKDSQGRVTLSLLTILPPLLYALFFPKGFTFALSYAGVFVAILYAILPALMVYQGRYIEQLKAPFRTPGGKMGLSIVLMGGFLVMGLEIMATLGYLAKP